MRHSHLNDDVGFTPAVTGDILERGSTEDWLKPLETAGHDQAIADRIMRVRRAHETFGTLALWIDIVDPSNKRRRSPP